MSLHRIDLIGCHLNGAVGSYRCDCPITSMRKGDQIDASADQIDVIADHLRPVAFTSFVTLLVDDAVTNWPSPEPATIPRSCRLESGPRICAKFFRPLTARWSRSMTSVWKCVPVRS